jgi:hypothetical protein
MHMAKVGIGQLSNLLVRERGPEPRQIARCGTLSRRCLCRRRDPGRRTQDATQRGGRQGEQGSP